MPAILLVIHAAGLTVLQLTLLHLAQLGGGETKSAISLVSSLLLYHFMDALDQFIVCEVETLLREIDELGTAQGGAALLMRHTACLITKRGVSSVIKVVNNQRLCV